MSKNNNLVRRIYIIIGSSLIVTAIVVFISWQWTIHTAEHKLINYVNTIFESIPEPQGAVPEERRDNTMPTLSIDGTDFIGILEIPHYNSVLPVSMNWDNLYKYPCHFSGSIYDRSLQIGGTSQKGQYDFYRNISVGDSVFFTDMEGNRFSYEVTNVRYEKNADKTSLQREDSSLILFIKNIYALEYIIIYCDVLN